MCPPTGPTVQSLISEGGSHHGCCWADVHKRTHTFVAVSEVGKEIGQLTVAATSRGHAQALRWARARFGEELTWAIEDCRHLSARLERDLLTAGQHVVRVPPKMMAEQRRVARTRGKSDPIDALAVGRAFLREPDLPVASHDEVSREAKVLVDPRDALVATRTRTINSLLWRVHELDPDRAPKSRALDLAKHQQLLRAWLITLGGVVAEMALDELEDVIALSVRIKTFDRRIRVLARQHAPNLVALPGCGELSAAKLLLGESAGISRFSSEAAFARHGGLAPIPVWSGSTAGRVRMTRSGNRQINCAIHRIAITQLRLPDSLGRAYYDKIAEGKTKPEALRCLKRRLVRVIFNRLTTDQNNRPNTGLPAAA